MKNKRMIQKICVYCVEGILFGVTWVILDKNVWHGNHSALASFLYGISLYIGARIMIFFYFKIKKTLDN
ncbi:hypothetical protein DW966_12180 [Bacteroides stercoris]|jgi:hypothetical protein|uniref:Uncharacterized protein n=2 Tax=Bacteroides stercoris TaxID=46506 RepID=A0A412DMS7_BACSE|nr:hypothetical protein DWY65_08920 [Bacteroides stercoris]RGZ90088.1 hypothetical protein DW966_12180 [Bacteroides stercoris]